MPKFIKYPVRAVGVCWFRKEDYPALLAIFKDADKMSSTWEEWLEGAEKMEKRAQTEGHITERVYIDPDTFPDWCVRNNTSVDRDGRNLFIAHVMAGKYKNQS
jgi:hypothetical protein